MSVRMISSKTNLPWSCLFCRFRNWYFSSFFTKASMPRTGWSLVFLLTMIATITAKFVALHFQFTFVQTILLLAFSINQLCQPDKSTLEYFLYPTIVGTPLTKIGWTESLTCTSVQFRDTWLMMPTFPLALWRFMPFVAASAPPRRSSKRQLEECVLIATELCLLLVVDYGF